MVFPFADKTLAQIVTDDYRAATVFARHGLDFCCKGKRSLTTACAEKGLDATLVASELAVALQSETAVADFATYSLTELSAYIVRVHHTYVKLQGPQTWQFVTKVASKHGERFPYMLQVQPLFSELLEELAEHMVKEEKILFPRIVQLEQGMNGEQPGEYLSIPVEVLEEDHERAGTLMAHIRALTNNYTAPEGACTTHRLAIDALRAFEEDLHRHVHLENNILFPKALALSKERTAAMVNA